MEISAHLSGQYTSINILGYEAMSYSGTIQNIDV